MTDPERYPKLNLNGGLMSPSLAAIALLHGAGIKCISELTDRTEAEVYEILRPLNKKVDKKEAKRALDAIVSDLTRHGTNLRLQDPEEEVV